MCPHLCRLHHWNLNTELFQFPKTYVFVFLFMFWFTERGLSSRYKDKAHNLECRISPLPIGPGTYTALAKTRKCIHTFFFWTQF